MAIKHTKLLFVAFLAALSVGITGLFVNSASAEEGEKEKVPAVHLQVSPAKTRLSLEPGASYVASMTVMNAGKIPFHYTTDATPYSVTDENYTPNYSDKVNYSQIADWVTFDKATEEGTIEPGKEVEVAFTINVPKDAPAGGQYAAIMAQTDAGNAEDANIKTINRVGMILYASVAGDTREEGLIKSNSLPTLVFNPPVNASILVENTGNVEATATTNLRIWKLFDPETIYNNDASPSKIDVIPGTSRFNTLTWNEAPKIGVFWAEQTVNYLGKTSVNHKFIIICPIWLMIIIFAILFFMIFWLVSRIRTRKNGGKKEEKRSRRSRKNTTSKTEDKND